MSTGGFDHASKGLLSVSPGLHATQFNSVRQNDKHRSYSNQSVNSKDYQIGSQQINSDKSLINASFNGTGNFKVPTYHLSKDQTQQLKSLKTKELLTKKTQMSGAGKPTYQSKTRRKEQLPNLVNRSSL